MRAANIVRRWVGAWTAVAFGLLLVAAPAWADRPALPGTEDAEVKHAIESGVKNLKKAQVSNGSWSADGGAHAVGYTALPALALLECGVSKDDPVLLKAEAFVRKSLLTMDDTYDVCLSILFLDRLGKKDDEQLIQGLAIRLIAGQSATGGWGYKCPKPTIAEVHEILKVLHQIAPKPQPKAEGVATDTAPPDLPPLGPLPILAPVALNRLTIMQDLSKLEMVDPAADKETPGVLTYIHTDNSVTQFALVALWTAQRHDVPLDRTLRLIANRFQTSQGPEGGWGYPYVLGGVGAGEGPATDCCGLLGLAVGHGVAKGREPINAAQDKKIINGFSSLNKFVGAPTGRTKDLPIPNYYFLWSLERVGVLYDLPTIAGKDWYQWGVEGIIANQSQDGVWAKESGFPGSTPVINTSLALLFLARTNLVADLTASLHLNADDLTKAIVVKVVAPPPPPPAPEPPPVVTPPKAVEPPPAPKAPPVQVVAPTEPAPPAPTPKVEESSNAWIWWVVIAVLVVGLLAASGVRLFFYLRKRNNEEKDSKKGKRKKGEGKRFDKVAPAEAQAPGRTKAATINGSSGVKTTPPKRSPPSAGAPSGVKIAPAKKGPST